MPTRMNKSSPTSTSVAARRSDWQSIAETEGFVTLLMSIPPLRPWNDQCGSNRHSYPTHLVNTPIHAMESLYYAVERPLSKAIA